MKDVLFEIMKSNAHNWVRYFKVDKISGLTLPGEYIEIRSNYLTGECIQLLLNEGFKIESVTGKQINSDVCCSVYFKRGL